MLGEGNRNNNNNNNLAAYGKYVFEAMGSCKTFFEGEKPILWSTEHCEIVRNDVLEDNQGSLSYLGLVQLLLRLFHISVVIVIFLTLIRLELWLFIIVLRIIFSDFLLTITPPPSTISSRNFSWSLIDLLQSRSSPWKLSRLNPPISCFRPLLHWDPSWSIILFNFPLTWLSFTKSDGLLSWTRESSGSK